MALRYSNKLDSVSIRLLLTTASVMLPFSAALAQGATKEGSQKNQPGDIIVTALKREQLLKDVPQSVQAFSGAALEDQGVKNLDAVLTQIPGATMGFKTSPGTTQYNFRGTGGQGQLGDMAVGFYLDDVPYYTPDNPYAPAIRFFDLESVEVLRGPQGTLYGQGSMGGTIIVHTAKPDLNKFGGRMRLTASSLKGGEMGYAADGTMSVPIVPGVAALRVTGGYEKTPGLAESPDFPGEKNIDGGSIWDVRVKLLVEPNPDVSILATYWNTNNQGDFTPTYFSNSPPTLVTGSVRGDRDNRTEISSLVVDWHLPIGDLKSSTSENVYRDSLILGVGLNLPPPAAFKIDLDAKSRSFNQEVTLASRGGDLSWIIGASYTKASRTTDFAQGLSLITPPTSLFFVATVTKTKTEQVAAFGEISKSFMDGLITPLVGVRYYRDHRTFRDADQNNGNVSMYDKVFSTVSPRFNLSISPSDNARIYFNVAKGFRSGNFNPQGFVALAQLFGVTSNPANPQADLWSYEVGGRFSALGGDLTIEPAFYYNDYSKYQFAGIVGGVALVSLSLSKVKSVGADVVAKYHTPVEGLTLGFSGNINKTSASNLDPVIVTQVAALQNGKQLPYTPKWSYSTYINLVRPLTSSLDFTANASLSSVGSQVSNTNDLSKSITDISLRLGINSERWNLTLFGTNLANQRRPAAVRNPTTQTRRDTRAIGLEFTLKY